MNNSAALPHRALDSHPPHLLLHQTGSHETKNGIVAQLSQHSECILVHTSVNGTIKPHYVVEKTYINKAEPCFKS